MKWGKEEGFININYKDIDKAIICALDGESIMFKKLCIELTRGGNMRVIINGIDKEGFPFERNIKLLDKKGV